MVLGADVRVRESYGAGFFAATGDVGQPTSTVTCQRSDVTSWRNDRVSWRGGELGVESYPVAASKAVMMSLECGIA
jgi:hypothetical protein